ncbi:LacI family DNA-binding transcriptional regulator [Arthrobacter sp. U41]|uniref:LacI family DNA-binding transcriptional regulator n=1 Tax=Arthrobacter sp. U41 TaxID=1849032 RepID=UPI0008594AE0|nr:LacI family DNA-binding transcriptional regulator [Arthrobacter sp. U41]AOT03042.1 transcriptional regulator [Arthrobacter sp. U41]
MRHGSKPTIRDVAEAAGVSLTTVSYVLSGRPGGNTRISQPTQDRVHAAAQALGYIPNRAARGMRRGRTDVVAVAITDLDDSWDRALAAATARILPRHGYQPVILMGESWRQFMLTGGADGVVLGSKPADRSSEDLETMTELADRGVSLLVFSDTLQPDGFGVLAPGHHAAAGTGNPPAGGNPLFEEAVSLLLARLRG